MGHNTRWYIFIIIEQLYYNQADQVQKVVDNDGKGNDAQYIGTKKVNKESDFVFKFLYLIVVLPTCHNWIRRKIYSVYTMSQCDESKHDKAVLSNFPKDIHESVFVWKVPYNSDFPLSIL